MAGDDAPSIQIRVLGGLSVAHDGRELTLPASKKTRALLGFLVVTGQPHRRERLCDLLWDGPDDPRAELRWSVSKLRPFVNTLSATRLVTDREHVGFVPLGATIDLSAMRELADDGGRFDSMPTARLESAARLFRGELLDGLDLPLCYRYQEWCLAERERASRQHRAVLAALIERLRDQPEAALPYARALTAADPLAEAGHAAVVRLLGRLGRKREAAVHYDHARRLLETELGVTPTEELAAAYQALHPTATTPPVGQAALPAAPSPPVPASEAPARSFVGRDQERALIDRVVAGALGGQPTEIVVVTGEPGIGKSHLLAYLAECATAGGAAVFSGRAYEAEATRPYGVWVDLLRSVAGARAPVTSPRDLGLLLPELGAVGGAATDRTRLFDAVIELLQPGDAPLALTLDDVHWLDEASCALLHYVARQTARWSGFLLACAARAGELEDNAAAANVLRSLRRDGRSREIALTPLSPDETGALAQSVATTVHPGRVFAASGGNPLFTIELARAHARGEAGISQTIDLMVRDQVDRLRDRGRDLLPWAAALGRRCRLDDLARILGVAPPDLLPGLDELERHRLIHPAGGDAYEFRHDLIRQAVYQSVSQPRRTVIHRQIARVLLAAADAQPALASEAAHHAALGNDHDLAVRACVRAGQHALRLFARSEARGFADRGTRHLAQLPRGPATVEPRMALLEIRVLAGSPGVQTPLAAEVLEAVAAAEAFGRHAAAATGHYLLSVLYQEAGDRPQAEQSTLRAAQAGRTTDHATQAHQFANTARCLLELETQIGRARGLIAEADVIAADHNLELCELHWASGLVQRWDGAPDAAVVAIERALALARHTEDRRREYKCLTWLAVLAFEEGHTSAVATRCAELRMVAGRMGEPEAPFAATLHALAGPAEDASSAQRLRAALDQLRAVDDKSFLAFALNAAAQRAWHAGDAAGANEQAREALAMSTIMRRQNEIAIARALLARLGDPESSQQIGALRQRIADRDALSARARAAVLAAANAIDGIPTPVSTAIAQG